MQGDPISRLTIKQCEVLRLVARGYRSKEIAIELARSGQSITSYAVDKRLEGAARALGAADRFAAARMLEAHEGGLAYETFANEPAYLPPAADLPFLAGVDQPGAGAMREAAASYAAWLPSDPPRWPIPTKGRPWNDLSVAQKIGWTALLLGIAAGGWGVLLRSIVTLSAA